VPRDASDPVWHTKGLSLKESTTQPDAWRIADVERLPMSLDDFLEIIHGYAPDLRVEGLPNAP
jgi:hypothetical protein